jgi:hypothetical protein
MRCVVVGLVHVREAWPGGEVGAVERMLREEVDVVVDDHQVAYAECRVHATRGVAHKQRLDAQLIHHTLGEGHLLHAVAFVVVKAAIHGHDVLATQLAEDEFAGVAFYCRHREIGYVLVGKFIRISYLGS